MNRKITTILIVLLLCVTVGAFAAEKKSSSLPWLVNYNPAGSSTFDIVGGWTTFGLGAGAAYNLTLGQFDIGPLPLAWGLTAAADVGFTSGMGIGAGAYGTLNWGFDWGSIWKFDFRVGLGVGVGFGFSGSWYSAPLGLGISQFLDWTWMFSDKMGLVFQEVWSNSFLGLYTPQFSNYALGVQFRF
jgi:hypothetical protein